MKHTLSINGREAELDISVIDRGDRVAIFATVGFVRYSSSGYKSVRHAPCTKTLRNTTTQPPALNA